MSGVAATITAVVALPVNIIGLAIPFWDYYANIFGSWHSGLWQICISLGINFGYASYSSGTGCGEIGATESLKAVRAMEILGMILLGLALVFGVLKLCGKKDQLALFVAAGCLAIVAGSLMIVGCIIYAVKTQEEVDPAEVRDLHAGFGMCIVAGCLSIIAGILYIADRRQANSQPGQIITGAQPGSAPYHVGYSPGAGYAVGSPGTVISAPATGEYPVAAYSAGPAGAKVIAY